MHHQAALFDERIQAPDIMQCVVEALPPGKRLDFAKAHRTAAAALAANVGRVPLATGPDRGVTVFVETVMRILWMPCGADYSGSTFERECVEWYVRGKESLELLTDEDRDNLAIHERHAKRYHYANCGSEKLYYSEAREKSEETMEGLRKLLSQLL